MKPLKIGLFMNARDEDNLKEWVSHHLLLGFDNLVIFDHKSIVPIRTIFQPMQKKVQVFECNLEKSIKIPLMNEAIKIAKELKLDWFIYLDADEFIILNKIQKINDFIQIYKDFDSIGINWVMFGSNFHDKCPNGLIINNFTKTTNENLNKHLKSFVKTNQIIKANNPHFYLMKNPKAMVGIDYKILNLPYSQYDCKLNRNQVNAYIAHYAIQSKETFIKRKINRLRDDTGTLREKPDFKLLNIHLLYNNRENLGPKNKYGNQIQQFLNKNSIFI